ncbi:M23 family metallopeptidase [Roseomonas sp. CCTCC AB2023176]|uniref:M23 family metallopeptidase n=1 Tax=Roseomonas sp. CCTCC AB2023176 TaxID=3342640 RepID=UPI0035E2B722
MYFPLKEKPKDSYHERPRKFGAPRSHGKRKHAGCDLYAPVGTGVYAVADGKVLAAYPFYLGTWAVEVDHGDFVVRYGEVQKKLGPGVTPGARILAGAEIGTIGRLEGLTVSMVHFEMYAGTETGPLTVKGGKGKFAAYQRRDDLLDPTPYLDEALMLSGRLDGTKPPLRSITTPNPGGMCFVGSWF